MAQRILRPLDYGALFDEVFDLYKRNILLFAGIAGIVYLPFFLVQYTFMSNMMGSINRNGPSGPSAGMIFGMLGLMVVLIFIFVPLTYAVTAAITWAVSQTYLGERPTILESYKAIFPRIGAFILTVTLTAIITMAGFLFCVIPGIALTLLLAFVSEVFIIENLAYTDAIRRSWELAKTDWGRVLAVGIITFILAIIVSYAITLPFEFLMMIPGGSAQHPGLLVIQGFIQGVAQALVMPLQVIVFVLLYYDIRVRKEGFDIEMLARNLGAPSPAAVVPAPETPILSVNPTPDHGAIVQPPPLPTASESPQMTDEQRTEEPAGPKTEIPEEGVSHDGD